MQLDTRQFEKALKDYASVSRRDFAFIVNKAIANIAARASGFAPVGNRADIERLESRRWWPAFVQKAINVSGGMAIKQRRKARGAEITSAYRDRATGELRYGRKRVAVHRMVGAGYGAASKSDLRRISRAIVKSRRRTWKAMRALFGVAALQFGVPLGKFERPGRMFALAHRKASLANPGAWFKLAWKNTRGDWPPSAYGRRPSPAEDVMQKKAIAQRAAQRGVDFVAADMQKWALERMRATARKFGRVA